MGSFNAGGEGMASRSGSWVLSGLMLLMGSVGALAEGEGMRFDLPIDCEPGTSCWIANYVDVDPGPGVKDFTCGPRSYDTHRGTDFALRDLATMRAGVAVRAAAPGTVRGLRDGMKDVDYRELDKSEIEGRECGNGLVIDHGNGWTSQYCHLMRLSLRVRKGQRVKTGDTLGLVGMSGRTVFPHLHFTIRRDKKVIDPFTGSANTERCGVKGDSVWTPAVRDALPYRPAAIYNMGIVDRVPDHRVIRDRGYAVEEGLSRGAPLFLWVDILGVRQADTITLSVTGPDGKVAMSKTLPVPKTQARRFVYIGRRPGSRGWPPGTYRGKVTLTRKLEGGAFEDSLSTEATVR